MSLSYNIPSFNKLFQIILYHFVVPYIIHSSLKKKVYSELLLHSFRLTPRSEFLDWIFMLDVSSLNIQFKLSNCLPYETNIFDFRLFWVKYFFNLFYCAMACIVLIVLMHWHYRFSVIYLFLFNKSLNQSVLLIHKVLSNETKTYNLDLQLM